MGGVGRPLGEPVSARDEETKKEERRRKKGLWANQ
jgi:hypothetical protein